MLTSHFSGYHTNNAKRLAHAEKVADAQKRKQRR